MKRPWALTLTLLTLLMACSGKFCGDSYLAELVTHGGDVQRDEARAVGTWGAVSDGDRFRIGDGLRTGHTGTAQLGLAADGVALVEANTVLRFLDRDPRGGGRRLALEEGIVRIESGALTLDVHTARGFARLEQGANVRIISAEQDTRFDVLVGRVAIDTDGQVKELLAGQTFSIGGAQLLPTEGPADAGGAPVLAAAPPREPEPHSTVDLALPELDSMTLHAPSLPVTFRLQPPPCAGILTAELDGQKAPQAEADANGLSLRVTQPGAHRLRLRCGKRVVRETTLRVQRDGANLELPKSAQRVEVEADGRRYTVRYQNVMPVVNVHWSDARPAKSYVLILRRGKRDQSFRVNRPVRELAGAELSEGNYEFWFTGENGQRSEVGSLRIEFDNTARSLSLSEPAEGSVAEGDTVLVSGVALLRSQVSANGAPLPLDSKGRFHAQIPLTTERSVLVRAIHPAAGVHYYLRRMR